MKKTNTSFFENEDNKQILYNLGKIASYTGLLLFFYHGIEHIINHTKVKFSMIGILLTSIISLLLTFPYKWDKYWMRINTIIVLIIDIIILCVYLYTLTF